MVPELLSVAESTRFLSLPLASVIVPVLVRVRPETPCPSMFPAVHWKRPAGKSKVAPPLPTKIVPPASWTAPAPVPV